MQRQYYFMRHAIPINDAGSFHLSSFDKDMQGKQDESLSEKGKQQAAALKGIVQKLDVQEIVSSTMKRAVETASIISGETGIFYQHQFDRLVEIVPGSYPMRHRAWMRFFLSKRWPDKLRKKNGMGLYYFLAIYYLVQWYRGKTKGGNSLSEIYLDIDEMLRILDCYRAERILIVGHGYWIFFLGMKVLGPGKWKVFRLSWVVDYCSITRVDSNGLGNYQLRYFALPYDSIRDL
jgi:broad specificity phosphatase PhoE